MPLISKLISKLQGARYFTKLDIHWGFNNVQMKEGDEWKAAFQTNQGLYELLVMFFGFSHIAWPLFDLTKGDSVFKWSSEEQLAFDTLKDKITSAPILALPDNSRPYRVKADSSDFATRAV